MLIRSATRPDLDSIVAIYNEVVASSDATFDVEPVQVPARVAWLAQFGEEHPLLVAEGQDGAVLGFAYYLPYRSKPAYAASKETTVYVHRAARRRGVASKLYEALIAHARRQRVHALIAVLGGDNPESRRLHEKLGFGFAGRLPQVGFKFGRWVDTEFFTLLLA
jgi:phosphinothricin acetyltransferase